MQITIELPDDIANQLQLQLQPTNISRRVLELIAADNYRQGRIGAAEVRRMLNFSSRWETSEFLKREKAYLPYTEDDLEQDAQAPQKSHILGSISCTHGAMVFVKGDIEHPRSAILNSPMGADSFG